MDSVLGDFGPDDHMFEKRVSCYRAKIMLKAAHDKANNSYFLSRQIFTHSLTHSILPRIL